MAPKQKTAQELQNEILFDNSENTKGFLAGLIETVTGSSRTREQSVEVMDSKLVNEGLKIASDDKAIRETLKAVENIEDKTGVRVQIKGDGQLSGRVLSEIEFWTQEDEHGNRKARSMGSVLWKSLRYGGLSSFFDVLVRRSPFYSLIKKNPEIMYFPELTQEGVKVAKKAKKTVETGKKIAGDVDHVRDELRENPAAMQAIDDSIKIAKGKFKKTFKFGRMVAPRTLVSETAENLTPVLRLCAQYPIETARSVSKLKKIGVVLQKVPGNGNVVGNYVVGASTHYVNEAREKGTLGDFPETIASSSDWEAAMLFGSWKSGKRLFYDRLYKGIDNGDALWKQVADFGINAVGDGVFIAGVVSGFVTFGAGAVAGVAARGGIVAAGRRFLAKVGRSEAIEEVEKVTGQLVEKNVLKEGVKKGGELALKVMKNNRMALTQEVAFAAFDHFVPDGVIAQAAINIALTPGQKDLMKFVQSRKMAA